MKLMKKWYAVLLALIVIAAACPRAAYADGTSVVIAASKTSVAPGGTFTVSVGFQSSRMAMVQMDIGYDSGVLTLSKTESVAATKVGSGNPFTVLYDSSTGSKAETLVKLTFTVNAGAAAGTKASVRVTNGIDDEGTPTNNASVSITVAAPAPPPASSKTPTVPPKPSTPTLSNNAKLKSLSIDGVAMSFSPNVAEYSANVPAETTSLDVKAEAAEKNAKVSIMCNSKTITGSATLKTGANYIIVKVVAPDGKTTKNYNIVIVRAAAAASTAPSKAPVSQAPAPSQAPTPSAPESDTAASVPPLSVESDPSSTAPDVSSKPDSSAPDSSDDPSSEATSSAEPERPNAFRAWLRADHSRWAIHAAYIGGMIVCLLAGCALGYFIRGRRDSE